MGSYGSDGHDDLATTAKAIFGAFAARYLNAFCNYSVHWSYPIKLGLSLGNHGHEFIIFCRLSLHFDVFLLVHLLNNFASFYCKNLFELQIFIKLSFSTSLYPSNWGYIIGLTQLANFQRIHRRTLLSWKNIGFCFFWRFQRLLIGELICLWGVFLLRSQIHTQLLMKLFLPKWLWAFLLMEMRVLWGVISLREFSEFSLLAKNLICDNLWIYGGR